ncbi:MAG TPA: acetoacetate decarboxylase family protein [Hyphomicrobiaceae bacterium]|nr:acetoacetate decarboxylase family protein [Hyphomicrobiaceae bacterium]
MPLTSPSFARAPYRYSNREYLVVTYRTSRAPLAEAVPEPLTFDEPLVRCQFSACKAAPAWPAIREPRSGRAGRARYHRRERKEKQYEEDCIAAYGRCRSVLDERRRSRHDRSGSERIRRF